MPLFRFNKAFGITRDLKVFLHLQGGLTRRAIPDTDQHKRQANKLRVAHQKDRQLIKKQRKRNKEQSRALNDARQIIKEQSKTLTSKQQEIFQLKNELRVAEELRRSAIKGWPSLRRSLVGPATDDRAKDCYITCTGRTDGVGAQINAILSTILFSRAAGIRYVHTPLSVLDHTPNHISDWVPKWERFFGLGVGELAPSEVGSANVMPVELDSAELWKKKPNTLYVVSDCWDFADCYPDLYSLIADDLKQKYYAISKDSYLIPKEKDVFQVAVHVRRGDVTNYDYPSGFNHKARYTDNAFLMKVLGNVSEVLSSLRIPAQWSLYSQGDVDDFEEFKRLGIDCYINSCPFSTFHSLVSADVLVMSKSSFSYVAGLLSSGVKIYEPWWRQPLKDWIVIGKDGRLSNEVLKTQIQRVSMGQQSIDQTS